MQRKRAACPMRPMYLNPLSLATSPEREAVLAAARGRAPFFHPRLKLWVVLDPEHVGELLLDDRLAALEIGPALAAVEKRFGISLPNLMWMADKLPLVMNGAAHMRVRSGLAKLLSVEKKAGGAWRAPVRSLIRAALSTAGSVEALRGLLVPIVETVFNGITHINTSFEPLGLTRVFDHYAGYRHLPAMDASFGALRRRLAEAGVPDDLIGLHIALLIFGRDALLSSMGEGLIDFALECQGRRLDDATLKGPRLFGGVSVGERLVTTPFSFAGAHFEEGQRVRLSFQGFSYLESDAARLGMFGAGDHSCLGRALALEVWSLFSKELRQLPLTLRAVAFEYERNSMFTMPRSINLELAQS
jgi:cytochrome P450